MDITTWDQVSNVMQVSRATLWKVREAGIEIKNYTDISDNKLDTIIIIIICQLQRENLNCEQQMMCGYLRDRARHKHTKTQVME